MITITLKTLSVVIFFSVDSFISVFLFDIDLVFAFDIIKIPNRIAQKRITSRIADILSRNDLSDAD